MSGSSDEDNENETKIGAQDIISQKGEDKDLDKEEGEDEEDYEDDEDDVDEEEAEDEEAFKEDKNGFGSYRKRKQCGRKRKLTEKDISYSNMNLLASLEHIVTVGNKIRHDNWRRKEYHRRKKEEATERVDRQKETEAVSSKVPPQQRLEESEVTNLSEEQREEVQQQQQQQKQQQQQQGEVDEGRKKKQKLSHLLEGIGSEMKFHPDLHGEDTVLYGAINRKNHFAKPRMDWPRKVKDDINEKSTSHTRSFEWDEAYGDYIHPLIFTKTALSKIPPDGEHEIDAINSINMLDSDRTNCTVETAQVPRALILRCWSRAVHAASSTLMVNVPDDDDNNRNSSNNKNEDNNNIIIRQNKSDNLGNNGHNNVGKDDSHNASKRNNSSYNIQQGKVDKTSNYDCDENPQATTTGNKQEEQQQQQQQHQKQQKAREMAGNDSNPMPMEVAVDSKTPINGQKNCDENYIRMVPSFDGLDVDAVQQCKKLGIELPSPGSPTCKNGFECTSCHLRFDRYEHLQKHFFGCNTSNENNAGSSSTQQHHNQQPRGCCWTLLRKEQHSILNRVLQCEVKSQLDGLLALVFSRTLAMATEQQKVTSICWERGLYDFEHVLTILEETLSSSKICSDKASAPTNVCTPTMLQTLQLVDGKVPLLLNKHVLESARARLELRYANVPK